MGVLAPEVRSPRGPRWAGTGRAGRGAARREHLPPAAEPAQSTLNSVPVSVPSLSPAALLKSGLRVYFPLQTALFVFLCFGITSAIREITPDNQRQLRSLGAVY